MNSGYRVGFHVSIAGGIANSVDNAKSIGCSAFQIFSRNPRGWAAKPLAPVDVALFEQKMAGAAASCCIDKSATVVHMPYLPNLSGPPGEFYDKSVATLAGELERSGMLGIPYLVIHLGSHMGKGAQAGIDQLAGAVGKARDVAGGKTASSRGVTILLENSAGQKNSIGSSFEELAAILDRLGGKKEKVDVCIDTCHAFAAGHDLSTPEAVHETLDRFDRVVGLGRLRVVHLNDSKGPRGSNLDRHEHIGLGNIGKEGLSAFVRHPAIAKLPIIMETPIDKTRGDAQNLQAFLTLLKGGS
jgi:deoxyribonuclease-4